MSFPRLPKLMRQVLQAFPEDTVHFDLRYRQGELRTIRVSIRRVLADRREIGGAMAFTAVEAGYCSADLITARCAKLQYEMGALAAQEQAG